MVIQAFTVIRRTPVALPGCGFVPVITVKTIYHLPGRLEGIFTLMLTYRYVLFRPYRIDPQP